MDAQRWRAVGWAAAVSLFAAIAGYLMIHQPSLQVAPLALVAVVLIAWQPIALPVAALLICQEFAPAAPGSTAAEGPSGGNTSLSLGSQLYFGSNTQATSAGTPPAPTVLPIVVLLAFAALCAVVQISSRRQWGRRTFTTSGKLTLIAIIAMVGCAIAYGVSASGALLPALNQEARPFLLIAFGFFVGSTIHLSKRWSRPTQLVATGAMVGLALLAIAEVATGAAGVDLKSQYPAFYDAALPALAGAVLLALIFHHDGNLTPMRTTVGLSALVIVLLSLRRNVWLAVGVALIIALVVAYARGRAARRLLVGVAVLAPLVLLLPGVAASAGQRAYDTLFALSSNADSSTKGHVTDLEVGWMYVKDSPITGIGSRHPPLPGLVVQGPGVVYVHNEWLLDWLRFGIAGVLLVTIIFLLLIWQAIAVLRARRSVSLIHTTAAIFLLMVPISCVTAPFLSTTNRWPALVGIAAGILAVRRESADEPDESVEQAADAPALQTQKLRLPSVSRV